MGMDDFRKGIDLQRKKSNDHVIKTVKTSSNLLEFDNIIMTRAPESCFLHLLSQEMGGGGWFKWEGFKV